jgi:DNA mismatch repair protein MSH5
MNPLPTNQRSVEVASRNISSTESVINNSTKDTENYQDPEDAVDADALNEVVMAVDLRGRGTVGCAYYVAREEKLFFMEDARLGGVESVESC